MDQLSPADLERLHRVCADFIRENYVSCPEATTEDRIYENAPELVERIAEVVGYWRDPDDED